MVLLEDESAPGHMDLSDVTGKVPATPGNDPGTFLNHYATSGPSCEHISIPECQLHYLALLISKGKRRTYAKGVQTDVKGHKDEQAKKERKKDRKTERKKERQRKKERKTDRQT
jgi:hypothetical protein